MKLYPKEIEIDTLLINALEFDKDPQVREMSALALGKIGDKNAIPVQKNRVSQNINLITQLQTMKELVVLLKNFTNKPHQ